MPQSVEQILQLNASCCMLPLYLGSLSVCGLGSKGPRRKGEQASSLEILAYPLSPRQETQRFELEMPQQLYHRRPSQLGIPGRIKRICALSFQTGVSLLFFIALYLQSVTYTYNPLLGCFAAVSLFPSIGPGILL